LYILLEMDRKVAQEETLVDQELAVIGGFSGRSIFIDKNGKNISYVNEFRYGDDGDYGKPGKAGLGGLSGDTAIRGWLIDDPEFIIIPSIFVGSIIREIVKKSEFISDFDRMEQSYLRAKSGLVNNEFVTIGQIEPKRRDIVIYEMETDYLKFLTEINAEFKNSRLMYHSFSESIIDEAYFKPVLSSLIERFQILSSPEFDHLLPNLQNEIIDCIKYKNSSDEEKLVLNYTFATISSTISRHKSAKDTAVVVNIKGFLEFTFDQMKNWEDFAKQSIRDVYRNDFEHSLRKKIEYADEFIQLLVKDIENNEKEINIKIMNCLRKITNLKKKVHLEDKRLIDEQRSLEEALALKSFFSSSKTGCMILSIFGPKGALIGSVLKIALEIGESTINSSKSERIQFEASDIDKIVTDYQTYNKNKQSASLNKLEHDLLVLEIKHQIENGFKIEEVKSKSLESSFDSRIDRLPDSVEKYEIQLKYSEYVQLNEHSSNKTIKNKYNIGFKIAKNNHNEAKSKKTDTDAKKESLKSNIAKLVIDLVAGNKISKNETEILAEAINQNANRFMILNDVGRKLEETHYELLKEIESESNFYTNNFKGGSLLVLDFNKWHIKKRLDHFKNEITNLINVFDSQKEISNILTRIENTILTIIDIYGHIEALM
jgi:hypothetical protein